MHSVPPGVEFVRTVLLGVGHRAMKDWKPPKVRTDATGCEFSVVSAQTGVHAHFLASSLIVLFLLSSGTGGRMHADAAAASAANQASTPAPGDPAACTVEPRPAEDFVAVDEESHDALSPALGTPVATPIPPAGGVQADPDTVFAVTKTMEELTACVNATDLRRITALLTDDEFRRLYGGIGEQMLAGLGTPTGLPEGERAPDISVQDVMLLPDGRVSAVTEADGERALTIFRKVGDRYLIDFSYIPPPPSTSTP